MASATSVLPAILVRAGPLPATAAVDGEHLERGHVYVAPPDHRMIVVADRIRLTRGPRENGRRPSVDRLFGSVARAPGRRAVGVILSGSLDDGTNGLRTIKEHGGATIVQSPEDALYPGMPESAIAHPAHLAPPPAIAVLLGEPLRVPEPPRRADAGRPGLAAARTADTLARGRTDTAASGLTCPGCGGALRARHEAGAVRYACRLGHAHALASLVEGQAHALDAALRRTLRSLELLRRMSRRRGSGPDGTVPARFARHTREAERDAAALRRVVEQVGRITEAGVSAPGTLESGT